MANWLRDQWEQIRGEFKWWALGKFARWVATGWAALMVAIATTLGLVADLPGYQIFFLSLSTFTLSLGGVAFCMFITNQTRQWWVFRQWERGARPLPSGVESKIEIQLPHPQHVPIAAFGTLSYDPPNPTPAQVAEFIKNIQPHSRHIKIKIVSSQEYLEFAKLLASAFRAAGFTFEIDHQRAEDIFLAKTSHDKLIIRYAETDDLKHNRHYPLLAYHCYFSSACQVKCFPKESTVDYFQIEIGGAP